MIALLIFSGLLTITFWWASRGKGFSRTGSAFAVWGVLLALLGSPPVLWLNLLGIAIAAAICVAAKLTLWKAALACLVATTMAYVAFGPKYVGRYTELAALRDKYPPVSIRERLAYETRARPQVETRNTAGNAAANASSEVSQRHLRIAGEMRRIEEKLTAWDTSAQTAYRRTYALSALNSIHDRVVTEFTEAQGFGVVRGRRLGVRQEMVEIPDLPEFTVPEYSTPTSDETSPAADGAPGELAAVREANFDYPDREMLREVHEGGVFDFANRDGFGFVASRERVFGFQPHAFRNQPKLPESNHSSSQWRIASLELVSLLKHETPAAYESENLPRMDKLAESPTRPLNQFETSALAQLRSGEQIVVDEHGDELQMLGSLRAAKQCTECHSANRGDLLGAFTYRLRRDVPGRKGPVPVAKSDL